MSFMDRINGFKINRTILVLIVLLFFYMTGSTYAYLYYTESNSSYITGNMGKVDLELDVTRVLPVDENVNSLLIYRFDELASNLNSGCIDQDGEFFLSVV